MEFVLPSLNQYIEQSAFSIEFKTSKITSAHKKSE